MTVRTTLRYAGAALLMAGAAVLHPAAQSPVGVQDPAWAPDGRRIAVSYLDRVWTMAPDGRQARPLTSGGFSAERDPRWSPDGRHLALAAYRKTGFDIIVVPASGGEFTVVTTLPGDERWPSWTPDGRIVFAHRGAAAGNGGADPGLQWDLYIVARVPGSEAWQSPVALTETPDDETYPAVSPDGARVVFVSNRETVDDVDLFAMDVPAASAARFRPLGPASRRSPRGAPEQASDEREGGSEGDKRADGAGAEDRGSRIARVTRVRGEEASPSWAPDGRRVAFYAVRDGVGSVWVAPVEPAASGPDEEPRPQPRPSAPPQLVSRAGGTPAWSPDGGTLLVAGLPDPQPVYNGNPARDSSEPVPLFAGPRAFRLWRIPAPLPVHESGGFVGADLEPSPGSLTLIFDRVWQTLRDLYYSTGAPAEAWLELREKFRPQAARAADPDALESVIDAMIAQQPLIKPVVTSTGAVVVSGHPLASEAGRLALEKGGNVVDAAIAVSFALGVVEPEASGIGGDGAAVLFLDGMEKPAFVDYKDQTPIHATPDNPAILRDGRLVADGPAAANIPGVVAGMDYLYRRFGSGKVAWADLIAPAIELAEEGFVLDAALPTSIAVGRQYFEKYPAAARIYLAGGRVPRPGERFRNRDYAATLRAIAEDGADTFYRGEIARKIAADMEANGGIITYEDLAQYRAIEREPIQGQYRGHTLYAGGPPLSTGIQLFESLHILEHYTPRARARVASDAEYFHYLIEAWKVRDQLRRVADPDRWPVSFEQHLTRSHAADRFKRIDPTSASRYERVPPDDEPFQPLTRIGTGTTAFAVADARGNMIAVTQTLSTWGGTFYVSEGLGFLYNNHLRSSRTGQGYGRMLPLMRSTTTSVPTLVFRRTPDGEVPLLAVGAAGNAWIPVSVYSIITGVIDGGLGAQAAVEAPRFLPGRDPADPLGTGARIEIEDRFPRPLLDDLSARGHRFVKIGRKGEVRYGYAAAVLVDVERGRVEGGAEPRRSHAAVAHPRGSATTTQGG